MQRWIMGLLLSLTVSGCARPAANPPPAAPANASTAKAETAPLSAFHGLGKLAFIKDARLYILDGQTDALREVAGAEPAGWPVWSADGKWLAFRRADGNEIHAMVAEADTGTAHELTGLPGQVTGYAWAPTGSALAVSVATENRAQLLLVKDPTKPETQLLAEAGTPMGALHWSPDGSRIAYVRTLPFQDVTARSDALEVVKIGENEPTRWYTAEGAGIDLAGWSPDSRRILFWVRPMHCNSCAADGLPLQSLALDARAPFSLPATLLNPNWLSWGRDSTELLLVQGGGRAVWSGKGLALCDIAAGTCRDLPQADGAVSLDPAWSPDGTRIAFVQAERRPGQMGFSSQTETEAWVNSRTLWLAKPDGTGLQQVTAAGKGVYSPAWARDGQHILYIRDNAIWVGDLERGQAQAIVSLNAQDPFGFYGQMNWSSLIAWWR